MHYHTLLSTFKLNPLEKVMEWTQHNRQIWQKLSKKVETPEIPLQPPTLRHWQDSWLSWSHPTSQGGKECHFAQFNVQETRIPTGRKCTWQDFTWWRIRLREQKRRLELPEVLPGNYWNQDFIQRAYRELYPLKKLIRTLWKIDSAL